MESLSSKKRCRDDSDESEFNSVEAKRIRDELLDLLDDSEVSGVVGGTNQALDSFMKSFEEEISAPDVDFTSESGDGESQPELGFLFEASDDELGLPPSGTESENPAEAESENPAEAESERVLPELSELWGFNEQISSYDDPFEFGYGSYDGDCDDGVGDGGEYVALDGLFDYTDLGFGTSDLSWRPETLPAQ